MISNSTVILITSLFWFLPMLVYRDSNLKYFFGVLGCTGFVTFLSQTLLDTNPILIIVLGQFLAFFSLQNKKIILKKWKSNTTLAVVILALLLITQTPIFAFPIICFAVMWKLQKIAVIDYLKNEKIDLFYVALATFQVLTVLYSVLLIFGSIYIEVTNYVFAIGQVFIVLLLSLLKKSEKPLIAKLSLSP